MRNPWSELAPEPRYVLPCDCRGIASLNQRIAAKEESSAINDQSIPEPFIGDPRSATVILLNLNPGDSAEDPNTHRNPQFREALLRNLRHEPQDCPFFALNPDFAWTGCGKWWRAHLRELLDKANLEPATVGRRLCVIEWFPYHSRNAKALPRKPACPSQDYSFQLAKQALERKQLVVGMRARKRWTDVDKRFASIPYLNNARNPAISIRNAGESLFWQIVGALSEVPVVRSGSPLPFPPDVGCSRQQHNFSPLPSLGLATTESKAPPTEPCGGLHGPTSVPPGVGECTVD